MFKTKPKYEKKSGNGKSMFLKFEDGKPVQGVVRGEPFEFNVHWIAGKKYDCAGEFCKHCLDGVKRGWRFKVNFIINENGAYVAKIMEMGSTVADQLEAIAEDWPLNSTILKITKNGTGTDTTYLVVPKGPLHEKQLKELSSVKLLSLEPKAATEAPAQEEDEPTYEAEGF